MTWDQSMQTRLDQLRLLELKGTLTDEERTELAKLVAALESDQVRYLAPAIERMCAEQEVLQRRLSNLQTENEELARLLNQQEQLVADARRWLAQFEQRHRQIQQAYARLSGQLSELPVTL